MLFSFSVTKDSNTWWAKVFNTKTHKWQFPFSFKGENKNNTPQSDLSRMLFPQILCLVNSYSSFKIQIRYHLLRKAFQATLPPTWFRSFPTHYHSGPWGFLASAHCHVIISRLLTMGVGVVRESEEFHRNAYSWIPTQTYWICILISPTHRWFLCILRRVALRVWTPRK